MAHYAFLNEENIVTEVITGKDENETLPEGFTSWEEYYLTQRPDAADCKRTSYNTIHNTHTLDGTPYRGNYAGIGGSYDPVNDVFINKKLFTGWVLNENYKWIPPVEEPSLTEEEIAANKYYDWNNETESWVLTNPS